MTARLVKGKRNWARACLCAGIIMLLLAGGLTESYGASLKVTLHKYGACSDCGAKRGDDRNDWEIIGYDDGIGATSYRWISYTDPVTGKKKKVDAYCMQPQKDSPGEGAKTAALLSISGNGVQKELAAVLYFANGGPGEQDLKEYLREHRSTYPEFQSGKGIFALQHMMLAYTLDPDGAFKVTWNCGNPSKSDNGYHKRSFQNQVKAVRKWCLKNAVLIDAPGFSISPKTGKAVWNEERGAYVSGQFQVKGSDKRQSFQYTVPKKAVMTVTHKNQDRTYKAGAKVRVYVGDSFCFEFDENRSAGISKKTVTGELTKLMPYQIRSSGSQDIGFYASEKTVEAQFSVRLKKKTEPGDPDPGDEDEDEPGDEPGDEPLIDPDTGTIEVSKKVVAGRGNTNLAFPFRAAFTGLKRDAYYAVTAGPATARISSDRDGNIRVEVIGSAFFAKRGNDLTGIPVKFIRGDGAARTLYTDAAGGIAAEEYLGWLQEFSGSKEYTIRFLKESFSCRWQAEK